MDKDKLPPEHLWEGEPGIRRLIDAVQVIIWFNGPGGDIREFNAGWFAYTGAELRRGNTTQWLEHCHPDDQQRIVAVRSQAIATGSAYELEVRLRRHDGAYRWHLVRVVPTKDRAGHVEMWVGTATDVHDLKSTEQARRDGEEWFRTLTNLVPQLIWIIVPDGTTRYFNDRWHEYTGVDRSQRLDLRWLDVVHPDDRGHVMDIRSRALEAGVPYEYEYRLRRHDGQYRWHIGRAVPVKTPEGRVKAHFGTATDVHDLKTAQAALGESEQRLRLALDASQQGTWDWEPESDLMHWSPRGYEIFGFHPAEAIDTAKLLARVHPDDRERVRETFAGARLDRAPFQVEYRVVRPAGSEVWVLSRGQGHWNAEERLVRIAGIFMDVTGHKVAEQALREADRRKDEFLATLAHELRNPMAPISNALQMLSMAQDDRELMEKTRGIMERQLRQLVRLVDDLLDVSRITRGKIQLRKERIPVEAILHAALETSRLRIEQAGQHLTVTVPSEPLFIDGDLTRLAQVLTNLLQNASKYSERGGNIELYAGREGDHLVLRVRDSGIGIPCEALARIFDMFEQVDRSITRSQGGLGIGLTLVRNLVALHGGTVAAHSNGPGTGSEFVARLPLALEQRTRGLGSMTADETPSFLGPAHPRRR